MIARNLIAMKVTICVFSVLFLSSWVISAKLPNTFKTCHRSDSNFQQCLKEAINDALKQMTKAYPSIGLNQMDPYSVPVFNVNAGTKGTVNFDQKYKDMHLIGISTFNVDTVEMDFDKKTLKISGVLPSAVMKGVYDFNGRLLVLPIQGNGNFHYVLENLKITTEIEFEETDKHDHKYLKVINVKSHLEPAKMHMQLDDLFNGDKQLGDNINKVLNENWQAVFEDVRDGYENLVTTIIKTESTSIFNRVPIDEVFPE